MEMAKLYGSLNNRIMENAKQAEPQIGMGATITQYTDRTACTIIAMTAKTLTVRADTMKRTDENGMSDCQSYEYSPNEKGVVDTFRL